MSVTTLRPPREVSDHTRHLPLVVVVLGLIPSIWTAWLLWFAPVDDLAAERTALAARDFTALWTAGRLASEHAFATLSDPAAFTGYLRHLFGPGMPFQIWPYPPVSLLLATPLAALPLGFSFLLYTTLGLLTLALTLRSNGWSSRMTAAILLSPAVATNILAGQNGTLMAIFVVAALLTIERRPIFAGLLLGGLCLKPQFGLLLPVYLLATRQGKTMLAGCMAAMILAFLSYCAFGDAPWLEFLARNRAVVSSFAEAPWQASPAQAVFSSVFIAARSMGANLTVSYVLQFTVTLACAVTVWHLWSKPGGAERHRIATTIALILLASPWVHIYDLPALSVAVALTFKDVHGVRRSLLGFAWLWPGLSSISSMAPLISVLSVASVAWVAASASKSSREQLSSPSPCCS